MSKFWNGRRVLVTGASGLLGRSIVARIRNTEAAVFETFLRNRPSQSAMQLNLTSRDQVKLLFDTISPDTVIHCAANIGGVAWQKKDLHAPITDNLVMGAYVLEYASRSACDLLLISSSTVYPAIPYAVGEELAGVGVEVGRVYYPAPDPSYGGVGNVKLTLEKIAMYYARQHEMHLTILRPGAIYGPWDHFDAGRGHVIPQLIVKAEKLEAGQPLIVWGSPLVERDFVYVDDVADSAAVVLENQYTECACYNIAGECATIQRVANEILKTMGKESTKVEYDKHGPQTVQCRRLSGARIESTLGWKAKVSLTEGLRRTIAWRKDNGSSVSPPQN